MRFYDDVQLKPAKDHEIRMKEQEKYDLFPWSNYFRDAIIEQFKVPKAPYFEQLPSGKRPDTLIVRSLPAPWFVAQKDTNVEEHKRSGAKSKTSFAKQQLQSQIEEDFSSLYWFTQHGKVVLQAAFMRFGPVKRVELMFEMESREDEESLCFDVYVQFKTFEGFKLAFFSLDGAILRHERLKQEIQCRAEYDVDGYFFRDNIRLREARSELESQALEKETKKNRAALARQRRLIKESVRDAKRKVDSCREQMQVILAEVHEGNFLQFPAVATAKERAEGMMKTLIAMYQNLEEDGRMELESTAKRKGPSVSKVKAATVEVQRLVSKLDAELGIARVQSQLALRPLCDVLLDYRDVSIFRQQLMRKIQQAEMKSFFDGCTLFAPVNHMMLEDQSSMDDDDWNVHMIRGPYKMEDLNLLSNRGGGGMQMASGDHTLFCQLNEFGEYTVWLQIPRQPRRVVRILEADIICADGVIVHIVDKMIQA